MGNHSHIGPPDVLGFEKAGQLQKPVPDIALPEAGGSKAPAGRKSVVHLREDSVPIRPAAARLSLQGMTAKERANIRPSR